LQVLLSVKLRPYSTEKAWQRFFHFVSYKSKKFYNIDKNTFEAK